MSDSVTLWTIARQDPLSMGFSRQEYLSGFPCPSPGDLPDPGIKPASLTSPALAGGFFIASTTWEAHNSPQYSQNHVKTRTCYKGSVFSHQKLEVEKEPKIFALVMVKMLRGCLYRYELHFLTTNDLPPFQPPHFP